MFNEKVFFMTNYAFIDVFVMVFDSAGNAIVEFQLRSAGDMRDQLAIRLRSMRSIAICLRSEQIAMDLSAMALSQNATDRHLVRVDQVPRVDKQNDQILYEKTVTIVTVRQYNVIQI